MSQQVSKCEQCQQQYTLFRRKKQCNLCGQIFCSKCVSKSTRSISSNGSRACITCLLIINENTTRDQLASIRVKHLRAYLIHSKIISKNRLELYFEKQDLINLIQAREQRTFHEDYVFVEHPHIRDTQTSHHNRETTNISDQQGVQPSTMNTDEQASSSNTATSISTNESTTETTTDSAPPKTHSDRITLDNISSLESINDLTIRQLKDILRQNFVSTTGCVEKNELINKVELLYQDQKESNKNIASEQSDENLCKICMDANIDCVFLDCGHLCTCVRCGKQLSECPLCRCYIIRVVRVFKS